MTAAGPLDGVRVLDLSRVLAGPHAGRMLVDLGADVIKVEPPEGDLTRFSWPRINSMATYFAQQNCGKRNISLDLRHPEAVAIVRSLAGLSDVVLENFRPGVMTRMGLDPDEPARGLSPARHRVDQRVRAGRPLGRDGAPTHRWCRQRPASRGARQWREARPRTTCSPTATCTPRSNVSPRFWLPCTSESAPAWDSASTSPWPRPCSPSTSTRTGSSTAARSETRSPRSRPATTRSYRPAEGHHIVISGHPAARGTFELYIKAAGRPELADDPRFATPTDRIEHLDEIIEVLGEWTSTFDDIDELEEVLAKHGLAMGVMRTVAEISHTDWAKRARSDRRGGGSVRRHPALAQLAVALLCRAIPASRDGPHTAARTTAPC